MLPVSGVYAEGAWYDSDHGDLSGWSPLAPKGVKTYLKDRTWE